MPRLTNHTRETVDFIVKGDAKNGVPPTANLKAGETRDISNVVENATYRGRIASGMISVAEASPARAAAKE